VITRRLGTGRYLLSFGTDIHTCAPVATVDTAGGPPLATQAFLASGTNATTLDVGTNRADTNPVDAPFSVIVHLQPVAPCRLRVERGGYGVSESSGVVALVATC
jgi:hypothetical protein